MSTQEGIARFIGVQVAFWCWLGVSYFIWHKVWGWSLTDSLLAAILYQVIAQSINKAG